MAWRPPKNLQEWLRLLPRHKKKFLFPALTAMILVVWASRFVPRQYEAEAKFERRNDVAMENMGGDVSRRELNPIRRVVSEDIRGRGAIEQLIDDLGLTKGLPHVNGELTADGQLAKFDLIQKIQRRVNFSWQVRDDQIDVIAVSYTDENRELAPKIANRLVENYIRKTRLQLNEMLRNAQEFFDREVVRMQARVTELERKKLRFEMDNKGLLPDDPFSVQEKMVELRAKLDRITREQRLSEANREALKSWASIQPETTEVMRFGPNPLLAERRDKLAKLEQELEGHLILGKTDKHPIIIKLKQRVEEVRAEIATLPTETSLAKDIQPNQQRLDAMRQIDVLGREIEELQRQRAELEGEVEHYEILNRNFFVVRSDYVRLQRDLTEADSQLKFWEGNQRKTRMALAAEVGERGVRLRVLQRAPDLARPSRPTPVQIAAAALVAGLGVGGTIVLLAELLNRSLRSVEHAVDELKLPVLGAINEIVTPQIAFRRRLVDLGVVPTLSMALLLLLLVSFGITYLSLEMPHHYENLMTRPTEFVTKLLRR